MIRALSPQEVVLLVQAACLLEVSAPKPGNVSRLHDFEDARFEDFLLSAAAIGPAFAQATDATVGEIALRAVEDTHRVVKANTNLGIVLLLAPLARAVKGRPGTIRERVSRVLAALTVADARAVYAAIRLAAPGGLGRADAQDVRDEPTLTLREAMALAADRDTIAREYVTDYDVTFGIAVPALQRERAAGQGWSDAVEGAYLETLAQVPDTLIARKEGLAAARAVSERAREVLGAGPVGSAERGRATEVFDAELRGPGNRRNPGATADVMAAALFVALAQEL